MNKSFIKRALGNFLLIQLVMFFTSFNVAAQLPIYVENGFFSLAVFIYVCLLIASLIPTLIASVLFAHFGGRKDGQA